MAGANAALSAKAQHNGEADFTPFVLDRGDGYIGVLIDDLTKLGTKEPYRMFSSRCEFRISLRAENADLRLTEKAYQANIVSEERMQALRKRQEHIENARSTLMGILLSPHGWNRCGMHVRIDGRKRSAFDILAVPGMSLAKLEEGFLVAEQLDFYNSVKSIHVSAREHIEVEGKYAFEVKRQLKEISQIRKQDAMSIPTSIDYHALQSLSVEERQKLDLARPSTLGEALRISGVTPASLMVIMAHCRKHAKKEQAAKEIRFKQEGA